MNRLHRVLVLLPLLVALTATAALAQANLEINPFAGYRFGGSGDLQLVNRAVDFDLDGGFAGGVTANLTFDDLFQFEFMWSRQATAVNVGGEQVGDAAIDYQGGVVLLFREEGQVLRPFVVGTLGTATFRPDGELGSNTTNFAASLGVGVKAYLNERVGLRFEFRGFTTRTDLHKNDTVCGVFVCTSSSSSQTVWQGDLRAGVMILF